MVIMLPQEVGDGAQQSNSNINYVDNNPNLMININSQIKNTTAIEEMGNILPQEVEDGGQQYNTNTNDVDNNPNVITDSIFR